MFSKWNSVLLPLPHFVLLSLNTDAMCRIAVVQGSSCERGVRLLCPGFPELLPPSCDQKQALRWSQSFWDVHRHAFLVDMVCHLRLLRICLLVFNYLTPNNEGEEKKNKAKFLIPALLKI